MTAFMPPTGAPVQSAPQMAPEPSYSPPGQQAPLDQHNYTPNGGGEYVEHLPGEQAPPHRPNISSHARLDARGITAALKQLRSKSKASKGRGK